MKEGMDAKTSWETTQKSSLYELNSGGRLGVRLAATTAKLDEDPREALSFMGTELVSFLCVCLLDGIVTNREGLTLLGLSLSQTKI